MKYIPLLLLLVPTSLAAQNQPVELGEVSWLRSYDAALKESAAEGKPVLILFQEVPGCATCRNYGNDVLSHPLIVEAIETEFVPLAIFNNKGGQDGEILKKYNEPTWNNPVVRIVDASGENIIPRVSGNYSAAGLADAMIVALIKSGVDVPQYISLLRDELHAQQAGTQQATYSMYCFWTGEKVFGALTGVVQTTAGFQNGKEVVSVVYDPHVISRTQLDEVAGNQSCRPESGGSFRPDTTPKYYLSNSKYRHIPMTEIQKCRVNAALGERLSPDTYLSPRQLAVMKSDGQKVNCVELSLEEGWKSVGSLP